MRKVMLAMLALMAVGVGSTSGSAPAAAQDYPYCIQGGGWGIPGDCSYATYAQCMASASGRRVYCNINPALRVRSAAISATPQAGVPRIPGILRAGARTSHPSNPAHAGYPVRRGFSIPAPASLEFWITRMR